MRGGRKPQPPTARTTLRLKRLHARKLRADETRNRAFDELVLAVLAAHEQEGASLRELAKALEVNSVQGWCEKARQIRREQERAD